MLFLQRKMGPKKDKRMRKIEVPQTHLQSVSFWDTAGDIQRRKVGRENREREEEAEKHEREREEARREETTHSTEEGMAEKLLASDFISVGV